MWCICIGACGAFTLVHSLAYVVHDKFGTFHRPNEMSIVHYLNDSERLYNQINHYRMELPTSVLA